MTHYALSLGAGVNSTALVLLAVEERMPLDEVVFADTGAEKPETYAYIKDRIAPFLAEHGVPLVTVRAKDTLVERCLRGHTIPDRRFRWSTRDYKIRPIYQHLKPKAPVVCYLGIAADEAQRVKQEHRIKWQLRREWPLIDRGITREGCMQIIRERGWPVPVKSGCFFCPFTRIDGWRWLWKEHPELYGEAARLERNGSKYPEFVLVGKPKRPRMATSRKGDPQAMLLPLAPEARSPAGLEALAKRFENEERSALKAAAEQSTLEDEECEGFCFT